MRVVVFILLLIASCMSRADPLPRLEDLLSAQVTVNDTSGAPVAIATLSGAKLYMPINVTWTNPGPNTVTLGSAQVALTSVGNIICPTTCAWTRDLPAFAPLEVKSGELASAVYNRLPNGDTLNVFKPSTEGTISPPSYIVDNWGDNYAVDPANSGAVLKNGNVFGNGYNAVYMFYKRSRVYFTDQSGSWYQVTPSGFALLPSSPAGAMVPPGLQLTDASGGNWTLAAGVAKLGNTAKSSPWVAMLASGTDGKIYAAGNQSAPGWYVYDASAGYFLMLPASVSPPL